MFIRNNKRFNVYAPQEIDGIRYNDFLDPYVRSALDIVEIQEPQQPANYSEAEYYRAELDTAPYVIFTRKPSEILATQSRAKAIQKIESIEQQEGLRREVRKSIMALTESQFALRGIPPETNPLYVRVKAVDALIKAQEAFLFTVIDQTGQIQHRAEPIAGDVLVPVQPDERMKWNGSAWIPDLDLIWERIKDIREFKKLQGFPALGKWFHSDQGSKIQQVTLKTMALEQLAIGSTGTSPLVIKGTTTQIKWKTLDGSYLPLTCSMPLMIVDAAIMQEFQLHGVADYHRAMLTASTTPLLYNINVAWPAVYSQN